jgi:1-deoxy-D-xylulose-5-phosphate reductoisomerase
MELAAYASLTFEPPDKEKFPALDLAHRAVAQGGTMPAVMNAANESAVAQFLSHQIAYLDITRLITRSMDRHDPLPPTLENILDADAWARRYVAESVA